MESQIHETIANYGSLSVTRPDLIDMLRWINLNWKRLDNLINA